MCGQVTQLVVDGTEIARGESRHVLDLCGAFELGEERVPHGFNPFAGEVVKFDLERKAAAGGVVKSCVEICGCDENPVEVFHLRQEFVDLRYFEIADGSVAVV